MAFFQKASIRTKLKLVILSTTMVPVTLVIATFFVYEQVAFRTTIDNRHETRAKVTAENISAASAFRDKSLQFYAPVTFAALIGSFALAYVVATRFQKGNFLPIPSGDVTHRKRLDLVEEKHSEDLEELVMKRTVMLEMANKELEAFSYSVSHDLRAPLRHIDGFAQLLTKHTAGALDEKGQRFLKTISASAKQMGILIDELLVFSRMGRSEMRTTVIDLNRMIKETLGELEVDCRDREIEWVIGDFPNIHADPSMMRLVLANLFSNAIKYTRTKERARIEVGYEHHGPEIVVFIRDNGVGFDMLYENKLFGVFQRLHRADEFEGTGIGLANVRRIIQRHGGRTWAEGVTDMGATFYFSLPTTPSMTS